MKMWDRKERVSNDEKPRVRERRTNSHRGLLDEGSGRGSREANTHPGTRDEGSKRDLREERSIRGKVDERSGRDQRNVAEGRSRRDPRSVVSDRSGREPQSVDTDRSGRGLHSVDTDRRDRLGRDMGDIRTSRAVREEAYEDEEGDAIYVRPAHQARNSRDAHPSRGPRSVNVARTREGVVHRERVRPDDEARYFEIQHHDFDREQVDIQHHDFDREQVDFQQVDLQRHDSYGEQRNPTESQVFTERDARTERGSRDSLREESHYTKPENNRDPSFKEFGALAELMSDPTIEEIWINSPRRIFVARNGISELTNLVLSAQLVRDMVERLLMWGGRRLDLSHPFVDARLPDGSRLHVAIPEVTAEHWAVNIRKHLIRGSSIDDLARRNVMSTEIATFLKGAVESGMNILVSGSTQAGKTTLLNALVSATPIHQRVITIEEVFELKPKLADCIALQTRPANLQGEGEIPLRKLIKEALRMRPSQLVVGEIREAEALDLLIALNSGLPGMATIHANSARDAIGKLQTLPLLAGENISHQFVAPIVASTIDLIVHTTISRSTGERRIVEIASVTGRIESDRVELEPIFTFDGTTYQQGLVDPVTLLEAQG